MGPVSLISVERPLDQKIVTTFICLCLLQRVRAEKVMIATT